MSKNMSTFTYSSPFSRSLSAENIHELEGIPMLIKDYSEIKNQIENAKNSGREHWYELPQEAIWHGPY